MKRVIILLVTLFLMPTLNRGQSNTLTKEILIISFVKLLANPDQYDGKVVQVVGYLSIKSESSAIYLHKEDKEHSLTHNALWVDFSKEVTDEKEPMELCDNYVIVVGTFSMKNKGHMRLFEGSISNITRLDIW